MDYEKMWCELQYQLEQDLYEKEEYHRNATKDTLNDMLREAKIKEVDKVLLLMSTILHDNM